MKSEETRTVISEVLDKLIAADAPPSGIHRVGDVLEISYADPTAYLRNMIEAIYFEQDDVPVWLLRDDAPMLIVNISGSKFTTEFAVAAEHFDGAGKIVNFYRQANKYKGHIIENGVLTFWVTAMTKSIERIMDKRRRCFYNMQKHTELLNFYGVTDMNDTNSNDHRVAPPEAVSHEAATTDVAVVSDAQPAESEAALPPPPIVVKADVAPAASVDAALPRQPMCSYAGAVVNDSAPQSKGTRLPCRRCDKSFTSAAYLASHMAKKHRVAKPPPAPVALVPMSPPAREVFPVPYDDVEAWLAKVQLSSAAIYLDDVDGENYYTLSLLKDEDIRLKCKVRGFACWSYAIPADTESEPEESS